ncbi:hypothetical protein [Paracoccus sp. Ld10]|uniref:hypothetical protein n=1 Tax=Paracoccus sp. Ld10 TaxID=649158 RepID=UPI00386F2D47
MIACLVVSTMTRLRQASVMRADIIALCVMAVVPSRDDAAVTDFRLSVVLF